MGQIHFRLLAWNLTCIKCCHLYVPQMAILRYLKAFNADRFNFIKCKQGFIYRDHICLELEMLDMNLTKFLKMKPSHFLAVKEIRPILQQVCVPFT